MALTQAESYADLWAAHRDRAGPLTPDDVWGLREDRHFQPPSRAHVKRIQRVRLAVTPIVARPEPDHSRRREINQAHAAARVVREAVARAKRREA